MLFLLVPTVAFSQVDFGATSSATTSEFDSLITLSDSSTTVESDMVAPPPDDIVMTPPPDDISDESPIPFLTAYEFPPQQIIPITTPVTGTMVLPHGFETETHEKFQDGYTWELDAEGFLFKVWDEDRIGSVPEPKPEYPQVTETYTIVENDDGTLTYSTHSPYIADKHEWKPYILGDDDLITQVQTNGGTVVFDKVAGAVTIFDKYENKVINSDSYVVRTALIDSDVWTSLDVNNSPVETVIEEDGEVITISFIRENEEGKFTSEYILHSASIKTTVYFTNYIYDNNKFAFTQTIDLPTNIISINNTEDIDLTNLVGQSFTREVLVANEELILDLKNLHYSAGLGFDNLWSVNITTPTKVSLDYANVDQTKTAIGETVELDPTYTLGSATTMSSGQSTSAAIGSGSPADVLGCGGRLSVSQGSTPTWNLRNYVGGWYTWNGCRVATVGFDISSIPDTAIIQDSKIKYDISSSSNAPNFVINQLTQRGQDGWGLWGSASTTSGTPITGSNPYKVYCTTSCGVQPHLKNWDVYLDANNLGTQPNGVGHQYSYNLSSAVGTNIQTDLGAQGNADIQAQLNASTSVDGVADWFGLGLPYSTMANGATAATSWTSPTVQTAGAAKDMSFDNVQLQITYYSPPSEPTNFTVTPNGASVDFTWSESDNYSNYEVSTHADYNPVHVAGTAGYGGQTATCQGGAATATAPTLGQVGILGNSIYFDGICDVLDPFNPNASAAQGDQMTFSVWIKSDAGSQSMAEVPLGKIGGGYMYLILNGQWASYGYPNNSMTVNGKYTGADVFAPNVWNHIIYSIAADKTTKLYVNGVNQPLYSTYVESNQNSSTLTTIGGENAWQQYGWNIGAGRHTSTTLATYPFMGWMDEITVWHDVLTPAEMIAVYEGAWGSVFNIVGANTLEYYMPMDDSSLPLTNYVVLTEPSNDTVTYNIKRNGTNVIGTTNLFTTDSTVAFNVPYQYGISAYNNAGGTSTTNQSDYVISSDAVSGDATNNGATTGVGGIHGNAWDFDGVNDAIDDVTVHFPTGRSVSVWVNTPSSGGAVIGGHNYGTIQTYTNGDMYGFGALATGVIPNSSWTHIVSTVNANLTSQTYVNGSLVASGSHGYHMGTPQPYVIGTAGGGNFANNAWYNFFEGKVDEIAIYNRGLTSSEASTLYNSGLGATPHSISATGLTHYFNFEQTGNTLTNMAVTEDPSSYAITLTVEPPTNLTATINVPNVDLAWTGGAGATGYKIETSTDGTNWTNVVANASPTSAWTWDASQSSAISVSGNTITNSNSGNGWNNWIRTSETVNASTGGGSMSFKFPNGASSSQESIGFGKDPLSTDVTSYNNIEYAMTLLNTTTVQMWQSGAHYGNFTISGFDPATSVFKIDMDGSGNVSFYHNGTLIRTSAQTTSGDYYIHATIYTGGNSITLLDESYTHTAPVQNTTNYYQVSTIIGSDVSTANTATTSMSGDRFNLYDGSYGVSGSACSTPASTWGKVANASTGYIVLPATTTTNNNCYLTANSFDISSIPDTATVTSAKMTFDISASSADTTNCNIIGIDTDSSDSSSDIYNDIVSNGTTLLSNNSMCANGVSTGNVMDFGSSGITEINSDLTGGETYFTIGFEPTSMVRGSSNIEQQFRNHSMEIVYVNPASITVGGAPDSPTGLSATFNTTTADLDLSWTAPSQTNGSAITGYKIEVSTDGTNFTDVIANTGSLTTTYIDTNPTMGSFNFYKVSAINAYGQSSFVSNHTVDTTSSSGNTILTFTGSSTFTPTSSYDIEYLVVAGGGAGGGSDDTPAGSGGGAGGLRTDTVASVLAQGYNVTVGTGGTGGTGNVRGTSGTDSTFGSITSSGGGGGCAFADYTSFNGGSGGGVGWYCSGGIGNTPSTTPSQGNDGGVWASPNANYQAGVGGGGSGSAGYGITTNTQNGSNGGDGTTSSITGLTYGGGGAGGSGGGTSVVATGGTGGSGGGGNGGNTNTTGTDGTSGTDGLGSGGGGGAGFYPYTNGASTGGDGGSGIVIVKFVTSGSNYIFGDLAGDMAGIAPDAPTITSTSTATPNIAPLNITVNWSSPLNTGSAGISNYEVYRDGTLVATVGNVNTHIDTVPTGGGTFVYSLKSVTPHGTSVLSATASHTTPTPPPAPTATPTLDIANPNPSPFDVTVSYALPSSGGSAITGFEIFRSNDNITFTSVGATSQLIFYDTVPSAGTWYYTFASTNLVGSSGQSSSGSITTATVPDVPSATLAINNPNPSPFDVTVSFVAPSSDGGSSVTGYNLSSSPDDSVYTQVATNVTADQTITVANAGTWYFKSQAINNVGTGTFGTAVSIATPTVPDAPTLTLAINNPNTLPFDITATFVAPASDGGSALIDYDLQYSSDNITFAEIAGGITGSYTHTVATAGTHYFQATVRNNVGDSVTGVVANMDTPTVPDAPTVTVTTDQPNTNPLDITSSFVAPADNGGSTITGYNLFISSDDVAYTQIATNVTVDQLTTVANAGTYYFKAQAINLVGTSVQGSASNNVTPSVPSAPLTATSDILALDVTPYNVTVTWNTPTSNGGSNLTGYDVYRKQGSATPVFITNTTALTIVDTVPSLLNTNFTYQIYAVNNVGQSQFVDTTITTRNVATAPALTYGVAGTTSFTWTAPASDATVTSYNIFRDSVLLTNVSSATLSHTDWTLITFGQSYTYEVQAVSILGNGTMSNSIVISPETEITGMIASGITGKGAVIDWDAPAYYQGNLTYNVWYVTPSITTGTPTVSAGTTLNTYSNFSPQLDYDTSYTFGVTITSPLGNSGFSNLVTITTNVDGSIVSSDPLTGGMAWFDIDSVSESSLDVIEFQRETQLVPSVPTAGTPQVLTDTLQVGYPSWWDDMTCNVNYKFAQKTEQYVEGTDMTAVLNPANSDQQVIGFSFVDIDNEVIEVMCAPQQSSEGDEGSGVYVMTQNSLGTVGTVGAPNIPLVTMISGFSDGSYGTGGDFGALNIVGLFAILISMVGFNRVSPIVGVILSASLIFALAWFGVITIPTVIIGTIALVIFLAWGANRAR